MLREKIPTIADTVEAWLADEREPDRVAAILVSLKEHPPSVVRAMLLAVVREREQADANRLVALTQMSGGLEEASEPCLIDLADSLDDGPVLAAVLDQTGKRPRLAAGVMLRRKLSSPSVDVRAAAVRAMVELRCDSTGEAVQPLLEDRDARVRREAAVAVGKLGVRSASDALLKLWSDRDGMVRAESLNSLRLLRDPRALTEAISGLRDSETQAAALTYVGEFGSPDQRHLVTDVARRNPSADILRQAVSIMTRWASDGEPSVETRSELDRGMAELQGASGILARWSIRGPISQNAAAQIVEQSGLAGHAVESANTSGEWKTELGSSSDSTFSVRVGSSANSSSDACWIGLSDVSVAEKTDAQFLASSDAKLRVWLNGQSIYERAQPAPFQPDSDRFTGSLVPGLNRLIVQVTASQSSIFHLRFRQKSSRAEHEQLVQAALTRPGNAERGGKLFFDAEKSQCIKCHRLGDQGERIGPELTGVGNRFSRIYIVESILEPSRTLAPSFESVTIALKDGRILSGLRIAETDSTLTLVDNQAAKHVVEKSAIDEHRVQPTSIMPQGLEKRFTADEFVDLVAFLVSQKGGVLASELGR
jgi:putative heme-binding domain-containing protein